jgi:cytochrome P450
MHGKVIRAGDKVVTWFASGNRDPEIFENANNFDVARNPNEHMTFGRGGPHMCLGNALARIELRIMFEDLVSRIDSMEITGPVDFLRSNFVHGVKRMPVKVHLH